MIESYFLYFHCRTCNEETEGEYNNDEGEMRQLIHGYATLLPWLGLNFPLLELEPRNHHGKALLDFLKIHHAHDMDIASDVSEWEPE